MQNAKILPLNSPWSISCRLPRTGESSGEAKDGDDFTVDYGLYQSFWRLQEYALKQDVAVKGDGAKDKWKAILHDVDKVRCGNAV